MKYLIQYICVTTICIIIYHNCLYCGFVFDDMSAVRDNKDVKPSTPIEDLFVNDFWGTAIEKEHSHKSYRPITVMTFRFNYMIHGMEPFGFHLVNLILHIAVCLMYYKMCGLFLNDSSCFLATLFFAVHPVHTEAVTGIVGRAELLSSVFFIGALLSYSYSTKKGGLKGWGSFLFSLLFIMAATLCKEQGITVAGICIAYELFVTQNFFVPGVPVEPRRRNNRNQPVRKLKTGAGNYKWRISLLVLFTVGLLVGRIFVMGAQLPVFNRFDNPASVAPTPIRQMTYNYLVAINFWLMIFPYNLCCDWTMGTIPLVESWTDPRNAGTVATYLTIFSILVSALRSKTKEHNSILLMGLAFLILPFIPASNLFFTVGFVVAERVLYMPSMGFCILVAYGSQILFRRFRKTILRIFIGLLIICHGARTYQRNWDWETEYTLFMSGLEVTQNNAKLFNNVGHALEVQGKYADALEYFKQAVKVQKNDIGAHINVGRGYTHLEMYKEAEEAYVIAKSLLPKARPGEVYQTRIAPNYLNVFLNLANLIARNASRLEEADLLYRQAISMRSDYIQAYINRGDVLLRMNRTDDAQEVYEKALSIDNKNPDLYYNLGIVYLEKKKPTQALAYLDKALEFNPDHEHALLNSAILIQELGRTDLRPLAKERLFRLLKNNGDNYRAHFNLGMICMDDGDAPCAEKWLRSTLHLKNDYRSAMFNLALLLADQMRPLEAVPFLHSLLRTYPDHTKGFILLGDIYINNLKDLETAENCYRRILAVEPKNIQALHNLCVVQVERGNLKTAARCFRKALSIAPKAPYLRRHLDVVLQKLSKEMNDKPSHKYNVDLYLQEPDSSVENVPIHEDFKVKTPEIRRFVPRGTPREKIAIRYNTLLGDDDYFKYTEDDESEQPNNQV